jgi:D-3-phosphoglycerate dehydrogenase / 2-oxoglutarate reductase
VKLRARKKVAVLGARYGDLAVERRLLGPLGADLSEGKGATEDEIVAVSEGAQVILCGGAPKISAAVIRRLPALRAVVRYGVGVDTVDLGACTKRGIYVANVPDYCIEEVATHALALILSWARKLPIARSNTRSGHWDVAPIKPLQSAKDLIVGVLGFGRIAQTLCRMARGIRFQVLASDPYIAKSRIVKKGARPVPLNVLLRRSDFISLHLPLSAKTRHIINAERLQKMKTGAYLVNTARGELIDERALQEALHRGWIAGAALDVMETEPPSPDHPLRAMENLILTPHCAWYTERSQNELRRKACAEVLRILRGGVPRNIVNRTVLR